MRIGAWPKNSRLNFGGDPEHSPVARFLDPDDDPHPTMFKGVQSLTALDVVINDRLSATDRVNVVMSSCTGLLCNGQVGI